MDPMKNIVPWVALLAAIAIALPGCGGRRQLPRIAPEPGAAEEFRQTGVASWYGQDFQGRETSNGEIYDMFKYTAAHQTLPFHSLVEVTHLGNGRKVVVRINDRGPFRKERIIDLSYRAAKDLGMDEAGTAAVALRIVRFAPGPLGESAPVRVSYLLQTGAFGAYENAAAQLAWLQRFDPSIHFAIWREGELFKILSERQAKKDRLEELQRRLELAGVKGFIREIH
jgi:rare lipoprotein A